MRTRNFVYALSLLACMTSSVVAKDMNLPVVSKGFQHEFWQTVKMGTEAAAKESLQMIASKKRIHLEEVQNVVHPAHVPLVIESER